jgi:hypothetical protein
MLSEYTILPPHWREVRDRYGNVSYRNDITGEESTTHPYEKFLEATKTIKLAKPSRPSTTSSQSPEEYFKDILSNTNDFEGGVERNASRDSQQFESFNNDSPTTENLPPLPPLRNPLLDESRPTTGKKKSKGVKYDYHCQWSERDIFGKVTLYGLTIRFLENGDTLLKFDGIDGEWTFTSLKGPYGCLEMYDLYIGAKINVFGRHLTISSANAAACHWIQSEQARLEKQQDEFRKKIELLGEVPCVKKKLTNTIRHITRNEKTAGQTNLRQILKDNARLGEQLANLGLGAQL